MRRALYAMGLFFGLRRRFAPFHIIGNRVKCLQRAERYLSLQSVSGVEAATGRLRVFGPVSW